MGKISSLFQSHRSGKFVSDFFKDLPYLDKRTFMFQSPRSGKFVSDSSRTRGCSCNSLCFNPLDRGNLYQIEVKKLENELLNLMFQSPRSGKFVSDKRLRQDNILESLSKYL